MTKKQDLIARFLDEYKSSWKVPAKPIEGFDLLEHGLMLVLNEHLTPTQSEATVKALRAADQDWNELRVSQPQEIGQFVRTSSRKSGTELLNERKEVSLAIKDYLQDVFQQTHGLSLEFLREDIAEHSKLLSDFKVLGMAGGSYLFWLAADGAVPVHLGLVKFLDKLGLCAKTTSVKKAQELIEPLVPKGRELEFTLAFHDAMEHWADEEDPSFVRFSALRETPQGKKAYNDWESARARAEAARVREEERLRKEAEKAEREAERERKKAEAAAKKAEALAERKRQAEQKKKEAALNKAKLEAEKKAHAEQKKKEAAEKKAKLAAEKKAKQEAEKKAAAKKAAAKKAAAKKATKKPAAKKTAKKPAAKKSTTKKVAKKPAAKKVAKKPAAKKVAKKPAAKKVAKKATKKSTAKKSSTRRR